MTEPIKWHATENGLCHDECEAWRTVNGNCPWILGREGQSSDEVVDDDLYKMGEVEPGEPCPVYALLRLIGRSPSPSAAAMPACETCPYFAEADETCRVFPPTGRLPQTMIASGVIAQPSFPRVQRLDWCGKHPKFEALRLKQELVPAQAAFAEAAALFSALKGV